MDFVLPEVDFDLILFCDYCDINEAKLDLLADVANKSSDAPKIRFT